MNASYMGDLNILAQDFNFPFFKSTRYMFDKKGLISREHSQGLISREHSQTGN